MLILDPLVDLVIRLDSRLLIMGKIFLLERLNTWELRI